MSRFVMLGEVDTTAFDWGTDFGTGGDGCFGTDVQCAR